MVEADLAFHRLLCELTGNATLVRAWETLTGPIRVAILFAGPATALANMSAARHQQLARRDRQRRPGHRPERGRRAHARGRPHAAGPRSSETSTCAACAADDAVTRSTELVVNSQQIALNRLCSAEREGTHDDLQRAGVRGEPGRAGQDEPARAGPGPVAQRGHLRARSHPAPGWSKRNCPPPLASRGEPCGRRCANCSRRAWSRPVTGGG